MDGIADRFFGPGNTKPDVSIIHEFWSLKELPVMPIGLAMKLRRSDCLY